MTTQPVLWTIGHTHHTAEAFVALLKQHGITAVADVRSQPYSRRLEQFNRETLAAELKAAGIAYLFLGEELGARRNEIECYVGDRADYVRIARLPKFHAGLERLRHGAARHQIALVCAEKEPLDCHRTVLVCRHLRDEFRIRHIRADGSLEEHSQTEKRLVREMDVARTLFEPDLTDEQLIQQAYDKRGEQIAYRTSEEGVEKGDWLRALD
jgi:uncharacterized protein (DUF488 family)